MNRRITTLSVTFFIIAGSVISALLYLVVTRVNIHPKMFVSFCGEVMQNISEHVHISPYGALSLFTILIMTLGFGFALMQTIQFILSSRRLSQNKSKGVLPAKLNVIINKHTISNVSFTIVDSSKFTAYTSGLMKPTIVLSHSLINQSTSAQLEAIVLHELYHVQNRHVMVLFLTRVMSAFLFFIPIVRYLADQMKLEFELAADTFTVKQQKTRMHLCSSLVLNIQSDHIPVPQFATLPIEKRVELLMHNTVSRDTVGARPLIMSIMSGLIIFGMLVLIPNNTTASFIELDNSCRIEQDCAVTDCTDHRSSRERILTPISSNSSLTPSSR